MRIPFYQVDAFAERLFSGNPAAVCPLESWLDDETLQAIAAENNLSETAYFVADGDGYHLRWFTPRAEVDLCGHATLASGWVILERLDPSAETARFRTKGGPLVVARSDDGFVMDFPARPPGPVEAPRALVEGLGEAPAEILAGVRDYLVRYESEEDVRRLRPDFSRLRTLDRLGIIVSAPGEGSDFVSRFFAPAVGVPEDPVTGSAHCTLIPFWADRLGRDGDWMVARQLSARGGKLRCRDRGDRVDIGGLARPFLEGWITL